MGPPHVVDVDGEEAEDLGIRTAKHWVGLARCVRHLLVVKLLLLHKLSLLSANSEGSCGPLEISVETSSRKIAKSDVDDARAKSKRMTVKTQNGT